MTVQISAQGCGMPHAATPDLFFHPLDCNSAPIEVLGIAEQIYSRANEAMKICARVIWGDPSAAHDDWDAGELCSALAALAADLRGVDLCLQQLQLSIGMEPDAVYSARPMFGASIEPDDSPRQDRLL
jgi:hypothetical protein